VPSEIVLAARLSQPFIVVDPHAARITTKTAASVPALIRVL